MRKERSSVRARLTGTFAGRVRVCETSELLIYLTDGDDDATNFR